MAKAFGGVSSTFGTIGFSLSSDGAERNELVVCWLSSFRCFEAQLSAETPASWGDSQPPSLLVLWCWFYMTHPKRLFFPWWNTKHTHKQKSYYAWTALCFYGFINKYSYSAVPKVNFGYCFVPVKIFSQVWAMTSGMFNFIQMESRPVCPWKYERSVLPWERNLQASVVIRSFSQSPGVFPAAHCFRAGKKKSFVSLMSDSLLWHRAEHTVLRSNMAIDKVTVAYQNSGGTESLERDCMSPICVCVCYRAKRK